MKLAIVAHDAGAIEVLSTADRSSAVLTEGPYPHLDIEGTWSWMLAALRDTGHASTISCCVVATHGAAFALLDGLSLVFPVMDYEFDGFGPIGERYDVLRGEFNETFSPTLPFGLNAGRQIFWLQEHEPESFARVTAIAPYPQYLASRLCGIVASEVSSLGSHTDLWQPKNGDYSKLVRSQDWLSRMPAIRHAWDRLGKIRPEVVMSTGLNPECDVLCGVHDSNASYLCHLEADKPGDAVVSTGTWVICMAPAAQLDSLDRELDTLSNVDVLARPLPCARFMGGREYAVIRGSIDETAVRPSFADADRVMQDQVIALPTFCPGVGPFPNRSGVTMGRADTPSKVSALASLYCALMTDYCLDLLDVTTNVIVEGRFVDDLIYIEALAHFRQGASLRVSTDATGTIHGAARLAVWPEKIGVAPPDYRTTQPPEKFLRYREIWRNALES